MSAWTKGIKDAPINKQILFRHPDWDCPVVIVFKTYEDQSYWEFAEELISDTAGEVEQDVLDEGEWAEIPV